MEVWLDNCHSNKIDSISNHQFDKIISQLPIKDTVTLKYSQNSLYQDQNLIGTKVLISNSDSQSDAKKFVGSVSWIVLEFEDWSMIPIENLIAASQGTPTKIAAKIRTPKEAQGAGFALETGVDALIVENEQELIEAAFIIKSQRGEQEDIQVVESSQSDNIIIAQHEIKSIEQGGVGERYCIDLTSLLSVGEGMLIGSSASSLALVHGEVLASDFVPSRPFRVNAGPPHSYIMMADGKTKYIAELNSGEEVLIVSSKGSNRIGIIGRMKIEKRPFLAIYWENNYDRVSSIFLQQAETVRVICQNGEVKSVTELSKGDSILCHQSNHTRHIGNKVNITSKEI